MGPHPGGRPGEEIHRRVPGGLCSWVCLHVGPPPIGGAMEVQCHVDQVAVKGRVPGSPLSSC